MKVTYLGNKSEMFANGYDFSEDRTIDIKGDTKEEKHALQKFLNNRYFHVDHPENVEAPKFYVYRIISITKGTLDGAKTIRRRENVKVFGGMTEKECENWIKKEYGTLNKTHYIMSNNEGIQDCSHLYTGKDKVTGKDAKEQGPGTTKCAVFKKKSDGEPYSRPAKVFEGDSEEELKEQAEKWIIDEELTRDDYLVMVK